MNGAPLCPRGYGCAHCEAVLMTEAGIETHLANVHQIKSVDWPRDVEVLD